MGKAEQINVQQTTVHSSPFQSSGSASSQVHIVFWAWYWAADIYLASTPLRTAPHRKTLPSSNTEKYSVLFKYRKKSPRRLLQNLVLPKSQTLKLYASSHCGARPFSTRFLTSRLPTKHHTTQPHRQVPGATLYRSTGPITQPLKSSFASSAAVVFFCAVAVFFAVSSGDSRQHRGEEQIAETSPEPRNSRDSRIANMT